MTPQQATADQATIEVMQHFVANISGLELREKIKQTIIKAMESRAPAPTEPAVDRDAVLSEVIAALTALHGRTYRNDVGVRNGIFDARSVVESLKLATPASPAVPARDHLLKIIAFAYQIAGAHDAPEHILAVLAHPESATAAQVDAMLPYQVGGGQAVPAGLALVPIEPTREMVQACNVKLMPRLALPFFVAAYKTMLAAAPQVAQASQPTSAEGMTAWAAYCPAGFQFIHADQRVVEDFVYTRRYCGEGPYSIMHMKVSRPTSAEGKDSERLDWLEQSSRTFCGNYTGSGFRMIGSDMWYGTLREAIDGAAMCDMGSIVTGKDTDKEATK